MQEIRDQLLNSLRMKGAHTPDRNVLDAVRPDSRGRVPQGFTYSVYQLLEHMHVCLEDIVDYCIASEYNTKNWPDDYWPKNSTPSDEEWERTVQGYFKQMQAMETIAAEKDLQATVPHSDEHTYIREILIIIDHNSYHLGQIVSQLKVLGDM